MSEFEVKITKIWEQNYPRLLRQISKPPKTLYYRGTIPKSLFYIAIIGSRKISNYGGQAVNRLVSGLAGLPVCIVSGLAFGVDAAAHQAALAYRLKTIAVLGSGVDDQHIYPRANFNLARQILKNGGALVSAYPPGTEALEWHFPERNQIISGVSKAVVIVEAAEKSGALITADAALDQNREIFAIPGSIFQKTSAGTNNLIKTTAAKLISSAEDIIIEFPELIRSRKTVNPEQVTTELSLIEREILKNIGAEPVALEQLLARVKITPAALAGNLILLEMKNKIRAIGGNFYARTQSAT